MGRNYFVRMAWLICVLLAACGKYPETAQTQADIDRTPSSATMIRIPRLPVEAYPALSKFKELQRIEFYDADGTGADDKRLRALGQLQLPKLRDISLLNCPAVTDDGIEALAGFKSLIYLQLEGTSITDRSMEIIAGRMSLVGFNVANCKGITSRGLLRVIESSTLQELTFSAGNISEAQIIDLINHAKKLNHCEIIDPAGTLNAIAIEQAARPKNIQVVIRPEGALQTVKSGK
jgi:hypothetical protein